MATASDARFYRRFLGDVCGAVGISPLARAPLDVEVTQRRKDGASFLFFLNHAEERREIALPVGGMDLLTGNTYQRGEVLQLEPADVVILRETKESKENGGR